MRNEKPHYLVLDGLRGVAALIVILYHVFECFDWTPAPHGYLAVDFFFVLSGFVIGYAYDDRWKQGLNTWSFFRRRLIRLHPMVVAGALIGATAFFLGGSLKWDGTHVATGTVMVALLLSMFMIPLRPGSPSDVRGFTEMFPLNGPMWSLFFEYIGNILYALLLRRLSTRWLTTVVVATGCLLTAVAVHDGYLGVGWSMAEYGFWTGLVRMLFPYSIGMLMARRFQSATLSSSTPTFLTFSLFLLIVACLPLSWGEPAPWVNGLYDALCVVVIFPVVVWLGASVSQLGKATQRLCHILGDLSYPLYAVHYPLMYLFYAHIGFTGDLVPIARLQETWPAAIATAVGSLLLAALYFYCYDRPLRKRLLQ